MKPLTWSPRGVGWVSVGLVAVTALLLLIPLTREFAKWLLAEGHPIEWLTFFLLLFGGLASLRLAFRAQEWWVTAFFLVFGLLLVFTAGEEIAWGQQIFGFETPPFLKRINRQGEVTLHNIDLLQSSSEYFRIAFGISGLVGVQLGRKDRFRSIGVPFNLAPLFVIIIVVAGFDQAADLYPVPTEVDAGIQRLSELVELYVAFAAFIYVYGKRRSETAKEPLAPLTPPSTGSTTPVNHRADSEHK